MYGGGDVGPDATNYAINNTPEPQSGDGEIKGAGPADPLRPSHRETGCLTRGGFTGGRMRTFPSYLSGRPFASQSFPDPLLQAHPSIGKDCLFHTTHPTLRPARISVILLRMLNGSEIPNWIRITILTTLLSIL